MCPFLPSRSTFLPNARSQTVGFLSFRLVSRRHGLDAQRTVLLAPCRPQQTAQDASGPTRPFGSRRRGSNLQSWLASPHVARVVGRRSVASNEGDWSDGVGERKAEAAGVGRREEASVKGGENEPVVNLVRRRRVEDHEHPVEYVPPMLASLKGLWLTAVSLCVKTCRSNSPLH